MEQTLIIMEYEQRKKFVKISDSATYSDYAETGKYKNYIFLYLYR